jgi:molybdopterin/thiamine biosynthesis adenylyltransferase
MALANFSIRAAQAAAQVLQGFDLEAFSEILLSRVVGVAFDLEAIRAQEGRVTLELTVNLLARLYPRLALVPLGRRRTGGREKSRRQPAHPSNVAEIAETLATSARAINPEIEIVSNLKGIAACLVIGETPVSVAPVVYIGSDGWLVRLSPESPVGSADSANPFGAGAAACFGAANIFRILFTQHLPRGGPDSAFTLSLFDFEPNAVRPANPQLGAIDLGESHLVGLGAIGNGAVWALARTPELRGALHLVDHENIELSNLQRYVLTSQADTASPKVSLAATILSSTGIDVRPHQQRWGEYLRTRSNWDLQRIAVAVDSARDRCSIQAALPRWIVNAWTQPGDLGVSRHRFLGDQACLACLYLPDEKQKDEDELIAESIGLADARQEIRELLYRDTPVTRSLIERIATARQVPIDPLLVFEGKSLRTFYREAICGGVLLQFEKTEGESIRAEVPMAFQSALAGIMLAAELIAHAGGLKQVPPPVTTRINLLRPLGEYLSFPAAKHPSGHCLCQDQDYVAAYQNKYAN